MITIRNFSKSYGDRIAISIESLALSKGVHWFKGKNGSGKTTLFKSISGIIPCRGDVALDHGITLSDHPLQYRSLVNYSEAEPVYPGFLTPIEILRFVSVSKKATKQQQLELLDAFGINEFKTKTFSMCSSGMVKKLSLCLAFLGMPKVIILDEPLITLDDVARETLIRLINRTVDQNDATCLISSHQEIDRDALPLIGSYLIDQGKVSAL